MSTKLKKEKETVRIWWLGTREVIDLVYDLRVMLKRN